MESEEMSKVIFYKYLINFASRSLSTSKPVAAATKQKKGPSYSNTEKKPEPEVEMELEEAIKFKKDLKNFKDAYDPSWVEKYWYAWWEKKKFFVADAAKAAQLPADKKFIIVVPPPNVTGYLHIGHGLTAAIEDSLVRWKRMSGLVTIYLPGTDHAGIATQSVVEKMIWKNDKQTRYDLGREKFLEKVWEWKEKHGNQILTQFRRVGSSFDWDRLCFTMDNKLNKAVVEAFIRLFERGLIYRSNRLVNWSCKLKTALSDIEVEYIDLEAPKKMQVPGHTGWYEFGTLTSFAYKVADSDEEIVVATTRLETMLGDTAVAVNSKDKRYTHLIGKALVHPFIPNRKMKVIADDILVDMSFGTGAVKITPGHDFNDYECGIRHGLEQINIFTNDGAINENGGPYQGVMRFDCRNKIFEELTKMGLIRGKEPNKMRLGLCSRSGDVIEPLLRPQWYVNCQDIAKKMIEAVKTKELTILPEEFEKNWYYWLENIKDWCISRQIWWGHRCPIYLVKIKGKENEADITQSKDWVAAKSHEEALTKASEKFKVAKEEIVLEQDEDVLDTWFSSALFPFSPFGWPDESDVDFKAFYPNTILETGHDILFFWVARMVMMGLLLCEQLPFKTVYLHPIIRDADGKKMSKSLGNVIDPLEIIDGTTKEKLLQKVLDGNLEKKEQERALKQKEKEFPDGISVCGGDALRFGLLSYLIQGRSINLDVKRIIGYRMFCNKIWQSFKFAVGKIPADFKYNEKSVDFSKLDLLHKWILIKLNNLSRDMNDSFARYEFGALTSAFHGFWLYDFCDIFVEGSKAALASGNQEVVNSSFNILIKILDNGLRLIHPVMPFITEELFQKLPEYEGKSESICISSYPTPNEIHVGNNYLDDFDKLFNIVKTVRSLSASVNLPNNVKAKVYTVLTSKDDHLRGIIEENAVLISTLAKANSIAVLNAEGDVPKGCIMGVCNTVVQVYVFVKEFIVVEQEVARLDKKLAELSKLAKSLEDKINAKDYTTKVPEEVRNQNSEKLAGYQMEIDKLNDAKKMITNL